MEFALENTFIKDFDGQLWKQLKGIPMGDPHSPAVYDNRGMELDGT